MSGPERDPAADGPQAPPPRARRLSATGVLGKLLRLVLMLALLLVLAAGVSWTLLHRAEMTPRIVPLIPGVKVIGAQGPLLGDFKASRIEIALPRGGHVIVDQPAWQGLEVWPDLGVAWYVAVKAAAVSAARVDVLWVPGPPGPPSGPLRDLDLPLSVDIGRVRVAEAHSFYWGPAPLMQVDGSLGLQVPKGLLGREHRVRLSSVAWQGWRASGQARAGTGGRMPVDAKVMLSGSPDPAMRDAAALPAPDRERREVRADAQVQGPLDRLSVKGRVDLSRLKDAEAAEAQARVRPRVLAQGSLDVEGEVAPLAAWPLSRLRARAIDLDLAGLRDGLPSTRLGGEVVVEPVAANDLQASLDLRNALPGPWDEGRLPVRAVQGQVTLLSARGAKTLAETLKDGMLDVAAQLLAVGQKEPGGLTLKGGWGGVRTVRADWRGLTPRALHGAAPPLQLQGSLLLKPQWREGLTALPRTEIEVTAQAQGLYGRPFAGRAGEASPAPGGRLGRPTRTKPEGKDDKTRPHASDSAAPAVPVPVAMNLAGRYGPGRIVVRQWKLQAQEAKAELRDSQFLWGAGEGAAAWQLKAGLGVEAFDPKVWLPWPESVTGANRLSGKVEATLNADWRGRLQADIAPSQLGGVPLQGKASWQSPADRQRMLLAVDLDAGGNTVAVTADLPWRRDAQGQPHLSETANWQGRVQAPALANLQAIAPLLGAARIGGAVEGEGGARGLWPSLSTQGRLAVSRFQWDTRGDLAIRLETAKADWQVDTHSMDAPVRAKLEFAKGQMGTSTLEQASLDLGGTLRDHRVTLVADATQQLPRQNKPTPAHVALAAQGGLTRDDRTAVFTAWQGQVGQLLLRTGGLTPRVLLHAQPFKVQAGWAGDSRSVVMSPAALNVMSIGVEVRRLEWRTASMLEDPLGELHADLQLSPLNLSTVMASWLPQAGWGGDLQLAGRIALSHTRAEPWRVDAELMRQSGDLTLSEPTIEGNVVQRLGIRQASLVVQARHGVWTAIEQFDGRLFGVLAGRQTVTVADATQLPSPTDALAGDIDMQIRNLRPWGTWLPAGWRLSGQMRAQARLAGTLGAPQYTGSAEGDGLGLGQALLGVNITDGVLQMKLDGEHLYLTRFEARSGSQGGSMTATGEALLRESPELRVSIKADRFGLLQRVDRRVIVSGEATGNVGAEEIRVDGRVAVDEGLIDISRSDAPTVGEDVYVTNRPGDDEDEADDETGGGNGAGQRVLNARIDVDLGQKLRLRGRGLDAFLMGQLQVTTPANKPSIRGTIRVENGTYAAYGQKLVIERGSVTFTGTIENPRLDILAMRAQSPTAASTDVKVGVNITGTALDPRVRLYSDPAMSETDKLSWLVLGRAPTGLGGADIGLLQSAAVALLSGEGKSPSDGLVGKLGLDELSLRQTDGAVRETIVNLGKQISKYWYVGYERSLNETSGNWQLIYRLGQRFTVRAQAGDDNALDFIRSWKWD